MTLQEWIERRELEPPAALADRLRTAVAATPDTAGMPLPDAAVEAALELLDTLLHGAGASRAGALGLLTADALMTYAFEAAADEPDRLEAIAEEAMRRIAAAAADLQ